MTFEQDPPRLSRTGSTHLRDALTEAKAELPDEERLASIGAAINFGAALDVGSAIKVGTALSGSAAPVVGASLGASKIVAAALALVIGTSTYYAVESAKTPTTRARSRAEVTETASRAPIREQTAAAEATPEVEAPVQAPEAVAAPANAEEAPDAGAPSEVSLLAEARAAVATSPTRALRLLEEHRRAYPGGALAQERDVMAIEAFAALGRSDAVVRRAERFLAAHEGSAHTARLRVLLEQARRAEDATEDAAPP